jgi:hypothetical protein
MRLPAENAATRTSYRPESKRPRGCYSNTTAAGKTCGQVARFALDKPVLTAGSAQGQIRFWRDARLKFMALLTAWTLSKKSGD